LPKKFHNEQTLLLQNVTVTDVQLEYIVKEKYFEKQKYIFQMTILNKLPYMYFQLKESVENKNIIRFFNF